ncbi:MAG: hypothetical protein SFW62_08670 [Alphaproteobacteria bacterium]|nr:hypothetical protein [Alphaproteobacteria bacterium]
MPQIISLPFGEDLFLQAHEKGLREVLQGTDREFHVDRSFHYVMQKAEPPELLILDNSWFVTLNQWVDKPPCSVTSKTPVILIASGAMKSSSAMRQAQIEYILGQQSNVIHIMPPLEQMEPDNFRRLIQAFDGAKLCAGEGKITREMFQAALDSLDIARARPSLCIGAQIISLTGHPFARDCHQKGLQAVHETSGKTVYVMRDLTGGEVDIATDNGRVGPELAIVDFGCLDAVVKLSYQDPKLAFFQHVPTIVVGGEGSFRAGGLRTGAGKHMNIIHCMSIDAQFDPENYKKLSAAFDAAKEAAGTQPVTMEIFEAALAGLEHSKAKKPSPVRARQTGANHRL